MLSENQGVVSLTFRGLSEIISRKSTMLEITFKVRISSRSFVCVPNAGFRLEMLIMSTISSIHKFRESGLGSSRGDGETPPSTLLQWGLSFRVCADILHVLAPPCCVNELCKPLLLLSM